MFSLPNRLSGGRSPDPLSGRAATLGAAALIALTTAGCAGRGGDIPYSNMPMAAPDQVTIGELPQGYPLGPLDQLRITVFRVPDLTGEYQVTGDGFLDLPLLGQVDARNQTPAQLAENLERRYGERYLNQPDVSIRVINSNQRNVTVEGGVRRPGVFALTGKSDLLTLIALGNGIDPDNGNAKRVAIFRRINGATAAAAYDLIAVRRGEMPNPAVYPGDIIVVDSNSLRATLRDVLQALPVIAIFNAL